MYFSEHHKDYIKKANVTLDNGNQFLIKTERINLSESEVDKIDLLHGAVGVATELGELIKAIKENSNVLEETSDICWYMAIFDRHLIKKGFVLEMHKHYDTMFFEDTTPYLNKLILEDLLDQSKKNFIYGKEYDLTLMYNTVIGIHGCMQSIAKFFNFSIEEARDKNIAKLKQRYGDKFSTRAALNRDLGKELEILKGETKTNILTGLEELRSMEHADNTRNAVY